MNSPLWDATYLGLLQGVTEFLPVSSSGHLAALGMLLGAQDAGLTLNIMLHAGTLLATAIVLRKRLIVAAKEGVLACADPRRFTTTEGGKDALFVVLASIPTAIIGLALRHWVEGWSEQPLALAVGFTLTSAFLWLTRSFPPGEISHPTHRAALLLGVAQGLAVAPGISRSGATIALCLFLGVKRERAFELSMLMSLPAVFGALLLELPHALASLQNAGAALFGAALACLSGIFAMLLLRRLVVGGRFAYFAFWTAPLAAFCFYWAALG